MKNIDIAGFITEFARKMKRTRIQFFKTVRPEPRTRS